MNEKSVEVLSFDGFPLVHSGDDLPSLIAQTIRANKISIREKDVLVVAHTVVSKAEGRVVDAVEVEISDRARTIAEREGFDPTHVELALRESKAVLRQKGVLITESHSGLVSNFSGVDKSNAPRGHFILLPDNPDLSASKIRSCIQEEFKIDRIAVIISDTQGRPWRRGSINLAIGCSGISPFKHNAGHLDLYGRTMKRSTVCQVDEIAAAAEPVMGQAGEGRPIAVIRGYDFEEGGIPCSEILRSTEEDAFR